jgi:spore maturation protein CgeB
MSYRLIRITNNYPQYISSFYEKNPEASLLSYKKQHSLLTQDSIETASAYVKNLNNIGVVSVEIITNATHLQNTWKKEHHLPINTPDKILIIEQIKEFKPEVVWIDDLSLVDVEWKTNLLKAVPSVKLFVGHHCAPYNEALLDKFKLFDILFTCIPCLKSEFEKNGIETYLLYHGFEDSIIENISKNNQLPTTDFLFSGSLFSGSGFHKTRIEYIETIIKSGIKIDLYCNLESFQKILVKKIFYYLIVGLRGLKLEKIIESISFLKKNKAFGDMPIHFYSKKLIQSSKPPVFGNEMYQLLAKSKICFNIHGEVADKCAGNIRLFEATGVGSCLVTDWKDNINELFEPGKEIVTYKTIEECVEKVRWLIDNPEEREKIAKAGQERTLKFHTIKMRVIVLNEILSSRL